MPVYKVGNTMYSSELYHFGILGQKWGVRRFQNKDGTLTSEGKERYGDNSEPTRKISTEKAKGEEKFFRKIANDNTDWGKEQRQNLRDWVSLSWGNLKTGRHPNKTSRELADTMYKIQKQYKKTGDPTMLTYLKQFEAAWSAGALQSLGMEPSNTNIILAMQILGRDD